MKQISKTLISWASILEVNTRAQAELTARMPFVFPHVALMPDAHLDVIWTRCKQVARRLRGIHESDAAMVPAPNA